jgi:hypothetical protein
MKLIYRGNPYHLTLSGDVDTDWANDINNCRSVGGHVFLLGGGCKGNLTVLRRILYLDLAKENPQLIYE